MHSGSDKSIYNNNSENGVGTYRCTSFLKFLLRKIVTKFLVLLTVVLLFIICPIFVILAFPLYLLRWSLPTLARVFRKDLGKMAAAPAAILMADDLTGSPHSPDATLMGYLAFNGRLEVDQFERDLEQNVICLKDASGLLHYPELQQRVTYWLGYPFWKHNPDFNLKNHIKILEANQFLESDLQETFARGLELPFSKEMSPWEFTIIQNYIPKEIRGPEITNTLVVLRIHHCLGDGFAMLKFLSRVFPGMKFQGRQSKAAMLPWYVKLFRKLVILVRLLFDFAEQIVEACDWLDGNPWHLLKLSKKYNLVISGPIPVQLVKEIKNFYKTSFNAVIQAAIAGGVRNTLIKKGQRVPRKMHLSAPFPRQNHPDILRNHFTVAFIKLPTGTPDPLERLRLTEANIQKLKTNTISIVYPIWTAVIGGLVHPLTKLLGTNSHSTGTISNMPGPELFSYQESPCFDMAFGAGSMPGLSGLTIGIASYNGALRIVTSVDQRILATQEEVMELTRNIIREISVLRKLANENV